MKKKILLAFVVLSCSLQAASGVYHTMGAREHYRPKLDVRGVLHKATPKMIKKQLNAILCWKNLDYSVRELGILGKLPRNAAEWVQYAHTATHSAFDLVARVSAALHAVYSAPKDGRDHKTMNVVPIKKLQTLPRKFLYKLLRVSWSNKSKYFNENAIREHWVRLSGIRQNAIEHLLTVLDELATAEKSVVQKQNFENAHLALVLQKEDAAAADHYKQQEDAAAEYYKEDETVRWARADRGVLDTTPFEVSDQELKIPKMAMWYLAKRGKDKALPMFRKASRLEHAWRKMSNEEKRVLIYANDIIADYLKAKQNGFPDSDASIRTPIPSYVEIHGTSKKARKAIWLLLGRSRFKSVPSGRKGPGELVRLWNRLSSGEQKAVEPMIRLLVKLDKDMKFKKMQVHNKAWVVKSMAKGLFLLVAGTVLLLISLFIAVVIIVAASNSGGDNNGIGGNLFFWLWLFDRTHNSSPVYIESDSGSYKTKVSPVWKSGKVRVVDDQTITAKKWRGSV